MVEQTLSHQPQPPLTENTHLVLTDAHQVMLGMLWVLQAVATQEYRALNLTSETVEDGLFLQALLAKHSHRTSELVNEVAAARALHIEALGQTVHRADGNITVGHQPSTKLYELLDCTFLAYFSELAQEVVTSQEQIKNMAVVMVAGHQGSGKGLVTAAFEAAGYHVLSMSQIVREVVAAWGLRNTETIDKIIGGMIFKEYFGADILVLLGLQMAASEGMTKVVIDGPRVLEEAEAVQRLGGTLISVVNDPDYENDKQLRRTRITQRAEQEPNRKNDVTNFDARETSEGDRVNQILGLVQPQHQLFNGPSTSLERLKSQVNELIVQL